MKNSSRTFLAIAIVASFGCSGNSRSSSESHGDPVAPPPEQPPVDPLRPGQSIICDLPDSADAKSSAVIYVLSAMNHKLLQYPDFARAIGVDLVNDCETGRRYVSGYAEYSQEHPDFDADEPLPPDLDEDLPPLPDLPDEDPEVSKVAHSPAAANNAVVRLEFKTCAAKGCPRADDSWKVNGEDLRRGTFSCTGTFITKNWILTAAHCMTWGAIDQCMEAGIARADCRPNWDYRAYWRIEGTISTDLGADGYASADDLHAHYEERVQARTFVLKTFPGKNLGQNPYTCDITTGCFDPIATANNDLALLYLDREQDHMLPPRVEDGAAKRLSIVEPDPNWPLSFAGWGRPFPLTLRQSNESLGAMSSPSAPQRIDMVTLGPAFPCPNDSGGPLLRTGLSLRTNRPMVENGVEAIIGVMSTTQAKCDGTAENSPLLWRATRVDTKGHRDFIKEKMHRWQQYKGIEGIQRDLEPPTGSKQVEEYWGKACSADGPPCASTEACEQPKRIVEKQVAGICVRCTDFPSNASHLDEGCNCVEGQCLPKAK